MFGPLLEVKMSKKCTPFWREAHFQVKMYKVHHVRSTFGSWDVQKVRAVVARSAFKTDGFGPLLEVEMSKRCTPLWREAHFQVKMYKAHHARTTFGSWRVEKVHAVLARSTFPSKNVKSTTCSDHCGQNVRVLLQFQLQPPLNNTTLHPAPFHSTTLHYHYNCYNYN